MKKILSFIILLLILPLYINAQSLGPAIDNSSDLQSIISAALDYAEGYYTGNSARMEKALHPALIKRGLIKISKTGSPVLVQMNAETLIEAARNNKPKLGENPDIKAAVLEIHGNIATAKVFTPGFNDYLHFVKQNGEWKLANVLWCPPVEAESANKETEEQSVIDAINEFYTAAKNSDAALFSKVIYADMIKRTCTPSTENGKYFLRDVNSETLTEAVKTGMAKLPEGIGEVQPQVLDLYEHIASAKVTIGGITEYLHLAQQNGQWRIVNGLAYMNN